MKVISCKKHLTPKKGGFMAKVNEEKVIILGKEIKKENYPKLYAWGKSNPDTLERNIKSMIEKEGWKIPGDVGSMMIILESDLK